MSQTFLTKLRSSNGLELALVSKSYTGYRNHLRSFQEIKVLEKLDSGARLEVLTRTTMLQKLKLRVVKKRVVKEKKSHLSLRLQAPVLTNTHILYLILH